ncbi:ACP S-malonyltransferase [Streptantibioticus silvisoli]|uniref:Malonyl CoA-acyl carrier protein transacylase n=1 Tax=Streptantibioticus silvisoli TaxID=2705255 RepID=A0ABT6VVG1_9ACTN|nr:ACP S-malonyltransferase [Streptantibioticus silvisoli]MDI5962467.1 ACP S-malonyltransferase [Streptantibioticus silvisoli]
MGAAPIGLVFPGQGTQRHGMGEPWRSTGAWAIVEEISQCTGEDVEELLLRAPNERLRRTDLAQLAVFTVSVLALREAERLGLTEGVVACAGHSLGEYTALVAAGALSVTDAAVLVAARGRAMREAADLSRGTMAALVAAPYEDVARLVDGIRESGCPLWVANVNAPGQVVVSGSEQGVEKADAESRGIGAKLIRLPVGGAFHSPFMAPAAERLRDVLTSTPFAPRHLPVVANVDAEPHTGDGGWVELSTRQLTHPVLWERSVRTLIGPLGCGRLLELGCGRTLTGMIRRIDRDVVALALESPDGLAKAVATGQTARAPGTATAAR